MAVCHDRSAGSFRVNVRGEYPINCQISIGAGMIEFTHWDLDDLEYLIRCMKREIVEGLGDRKGEVFNAT